MNAIPKKNKILIIDDDPGILHLLKSRLTANDFDVLTASDASSALTQILENKFDLLIIDILLPGMDGLGTDPLGSSICEVLKKEDQFRAVPIIIISVLKRPYMTEIEEMVKQADAYFEKPFNTEELIKKAKELTA